MSNQSATQKRTGEPTRYGFKRELDIPFDEAVERTRTALASQGFGILSEIDLKEKFKEKLGVDFGDYVILGACNPPLALEGIRQEIDLGLLLPCNVVVYQSGSKTVVSAIDAVRMMSVVGNEEPNKTAQLVNEKLQRAIEEL